MAKFILRVDDLGWLPPDKTQDLGLSYFTHWRRSMGLMGEPAYYGLIPSQAEPLGLKKLQDELRDGEELAVHGSTHAKGEKVEQREMRGAQELFSIYRRCRSYIPPFNDYHLSDLENWGEVCKEGMFFGGFHNEHHRMGNLPTKVGKVFHLPAPRELYDHTEPLLENIPRYTDLDCPMVVTLHATWGWNKMELLPKLGKLLKPHLASVDCVKDWLAHSEPNLEQLTAPHYFAYKTVLKYLGSCLGYRVLDFGSRYSALPSLMALRGCRVTAVDRDERINQYQDEVRRRYGNPSVASFRIKYPEDIPVKYDVITCCWSLQHNITKGRIADIVKVLAGKLNERGRLLIVGSYNHDCEKLQMGRVDPQIILDSHGYEERIIRPSGMKVLATEHFQYQHGTTQGKYCTPDIANAVFYELVKQ